PYRGGPFLEVDCETSDDIGSRLFGGVPAGRSPKAGLAQIPGGADTGGGGNGNQERPGAGGGPPSVEAAVAAGVFLPPYAAFPRAARFPSDAARQPGVVAGLPASRVPDVISADSLVARARGGTVLFANLPEMPDRDQARLARLLRDGEAAIADSRGATPLKLRVMAVVDSSWDDALLEGRVRQDLNRHVASARISIPPLRDRREDIVGLATHFLDLACASARLAPKVFTQPVLSLLAALPYRGNVAELKRLVENLALRTPGRVLRLDTMLGVLDFEPRPRVQALGGTLREARARFERQYIIAMLEQHKGRPGAAAQALGIQRTNLYRKMRELGIRVQRTPPTRNMG
ncbi:MAG: hypothetical protein EHM24_26515, partial [Acidobacteria bacterium]